MTEAKPATIESLLALWSIQDGVLQQYRVLFATMQSILVSFGGLIVFRDNNLVPMFVTSVIVGISLWMWFTVCSSRGKSVFFTQSLVLKAERGDPVFCPLQRLKDFQSGDKPELKRDPDYLKLHDGGSRTRKKMDLYLPMVFVLGWLFLWFLVIMRIVEIQIKFITPT